MTSRCRKAGFSLIELMVGLALVGLIVAMGLLQTRRATEAAESRGLAEELAEEMRAARRLAITQRAPVAVVFPSNNGASAHAQAFYTLQGIDKPRIVGGRRFDGDYPAAFAFVGLWPVSITPGNSKAAVAFAGNDAEFDIAKWDIPNPKDYHLIFLPSGHVTANGLTHFGGEYHVLVSEGLNYAAAAAPTGTSTFPVSYFSPSEVSSPYTICISPAGNIRVEPGVPGSASLGGSKGRISMAAAPDVPTATTGNSDPVLVSVSPDPSPVQLPTGMSAVVPPEGYLSLRLEVTEPDGQIPIATWSASDGELSSQNGTLMEWDALNQRWYSVWVWTPPVGADEGDEFTLAYEVSDGAGGVISGDLGATGKVQIGSEGRVAFTTTRPSGIYEIASMNPDGTDMKLITKDGDVHENYYPAWSPNGNQLACFGWDLYDMDNWENLYVVNADGSNLRVLWEIDWTMDKSFYPSDYWGNSIGPAWSADGTKLAYAVNDDLNFSSEIHVIRSDGSGRKALTNPGADINDYNPVWSPNETWILFHRERWTAADDCDIMRIKADDSMGDVPDALTNAGTMVYNFDPSYRPDGNKIVYVKDDWNTGITELRVMDPDGSNKATILDSYWPNTPRYSPDGTMIAFLDGDVYVTNEAGKTPEGAAGAKQISTVGAMDYWWSPDSTHIVYSDGFVMYKARVLGATDERRISSAESVEDWVPSWTY